MSVVVATIVFCDIVRFSKIDENGQKMIIRSLNAEISHELYPFVRLAFESPDIITIPTGDGIAIALLHRESYWQVPLFSLIGRLFKWRKDQNVSLRIGVHTGHVEMIPDINNRPNICGHNINLCQRVMDAANDNQVLFSDGAYRYYIGESTINVPFEVGAREYYFSPMYSIVVKHETVVNVYGVYVALDPSDKPASADEPDKPDPQQYWQENFPRSTDEVKIALTELPKSIDNAFSTRLKNARKVALIQLTGERLLASLMAEVDETAGAKSPKKLHFSDDLEVLWVLMADPDTYPVGDAAIGLPAKTLLEKSIKGWQQYLIVLKEKHQNADIQLKLYLQPPFFGASYLDWDRVEGRIHFSPYIWGIDVTKSPGYDIAWLGKNPSPIYDVYCQGLSNLFRLAKAVTLESTEGSQVSEDLSQITDTTDQQ